jgi:FMN phosphatase YigB (HAD superfamily)
MPDRTDFSTIVFDVNETLLDIATLEPFFVRVFGNAAVLREWFPELILYSQTVTWSGLYVPFGDLAGGVSSLCMVACHIWDTIGAQSVGCRGAFIARPHNSILHVPGVPEPDFTSHDLAKLADQIIQAQKLAG